MWNEEVAKDLAATEGVRTTPEHWKVINDIRTVLSGVRDRADDPETVQGERFKLREIYEMFLSGPAKGACKLAGLPSRRAACRLRVLTEAVTGTG